MTSVHGICDISDRWGFPGGLEVKNLPANAGDTCSILGSGISLEKETVFFNPLQYSCLGNPMDRGGAWQARVHGVTKESDMT